MILDYVVIFFWPILVSILLIAVFKNEVFNFFKDIFTVNKFTAFDAQRLLEQQKKEKLNLVLKSHTYKEKLKNIIKLIKSASSSGKTSIYIYDFPTDCLVNRQIISELVKRKFNCSWYDSNGLTISWPDQNIGSKR